MDFPAKVARSRSRRNLAIDEDVPIPVVKKDVKEVVAQWRVPLHGKLYNIEFEHGTTSGKRVIWVDGKVGQCAFKLVQPNDHHTSIQPNTCRSCCGTTIMSY